MLSSSRRRKVVGQRRSAHRPKFSPVIELLEDRTLFSVNPIVAENQLQGTPESVWDVDGNGDPTLQGYSTDISVNHGQTVFFKIDDTSGAAYHIDIYRIGYYGGDGARFITTIQPSATEDLVQNQPAPLVDPNTQLIDAGNWAISASWAVPATAVSGVYLADLVRNDTGAMSQILFIVRADESHSAILFQTSDATWEAYNTYGGNSLYGPPGGNTDTRAFAVSYNRPFNDRGFAGGLGDDNSFFYAEFPMVEFLEQNGYDVTYFTDVDSDRNGALIQNHQLFLSVGHDEYWTYNQFQNVLAARNAGVNLAFFSGNEATWETQLTPSIDGSNTADRTLITYKDSFGDASNPDPNVWTGEFYDLRFSSLAIPENSLTGEQFTVNRGANDTGTPLTLSNQFAALRFWRNTQVATLQPGQTLQVGDTVLGYEWDVDMDNGYRPAGLFDLSATTQSVLQEIYGYADNDNNAVQPGVQTNSQTLYRASSGALVFGAGTVQWSWGLYGGHDDGSGSYDSSASTPDLNMMQATVNLFADMNVQPGTLDTVDGLVAATASTNRTAPTSSITSPPPGAAAVSGTPVTISGTATAFNGSVVAGVEISTDGGKSWHPVQTSPDAANVTWTYNWTPSAVGPVTIETRAVDDSANLETPSDAQTVNVQLPNQPVSLFPSSLTPLFASYPDSTPVEVGVQFQTQVAGQITGIRFYKGPDNTGTHVGHLWTSTGTLLATVTFTNETSSGWQQANFSSPVTISPGVTYVASYYAPNGGYADTGGAFMFQGVQNGPLMTLADRQATGRDGVFTTLPGGGFPSSSFNGDNYFVDVVFVASPETTPPTVVSETPGSGATSVPVGANIAATFNDGVNSGTINFTLTGPNNSLVPATLVYNASTTTATLFPSAPLAGNTTYTATVSGVVDLSGNSMSGPFSWTFTTGSATAPPTILSTTPTNSATGISVNPTISASFNEAIETGTASFLVQDSSGNVIPGTVSYSNNQFTATFTPSTSLNYLTTYTVTVTGATDFAGNVMNATSWQFQSLPQQLTLWTPTTMPAVADTNDDNAIMLGVKFETTVAGTISGISFYKGPTNVGQHVAYLFDASGNLLAAAVFTSETFVGWQTANFATPVSIQPHTIYLAAYFAPRGNYASTAGYFSNSGVSNGPLQALSNATPGGNGVYIYGPAGTFPTNTFGAANYWVEPIYNLIPDTTPPQVSAESPAPGSTNIPNNSAAINVTFNKPVQANTISFVLTDPHNNVIPATMTYAGNTATLTPNVVLTASTTYTLTVSGTTDLSGNVMVGSFSWSFTTGNTYTLWNPSVTPAVADANDSSALDLGVQFETASAGNVSGIRFYKGPTNTGTHIGYLWTASGQLLASATFTNETGSGWQQVNFSSPVSIQPGTVYVASYYAPNGNYAATSGYFSSSGVTAGPLQALATTNGVYASGAGVFPSNSFDSSNYWVDLVFNAVPDTTPPTITSETPAPNATGVANDPGSVSATFSKPVQSSTISFVLTDPNNNVVPGTLSYSGGTAVLTPNSPLGANETYTATVSGATDLSGNVMTPFTWSFTTAAIPVYTLFNPLATPAVASTNDPNAINVGVKFETDVAGTISGIRFYKGSSNTGTHIGYLWDSAGDLLASATFTGETGAGWQQVNFGTPVSIAPHTLYIASYFAPNGEYSVTGSYFANSGVNVGPLHGLSNAAANGNGVYAYGSAGVFPTNSFNSTNYWVDVVFNAIPQTTPPSVTAVSPAASETNVYSGGAVVTATFSEPVVPSTISLVVSDPNNNVVAGSISYSSATNAATFVPTSPLAAFTTYTVNLTGATDGSGNVMSPFSWSFTTGAASYTAFASGATPANITINDPEAIELGVKFTANASGYVTGVRFYKSTQNTGVHIGDLWSSSGQLLATATFSNETGSGWQQVNFSSPVAITANTEYIASYHTTTGFYSADGGYFANGNVTNGPLTLLSNASAGGNGVYVYGASAFPSNSFNSTNYWVDAVYTGSQPDSPSTQIIGTSGVSSLAVSGFPKPTTAGATGSLTVSAQDSNGNLVTNYLGTITFTSSDGHAAMPQTYTFTAADGGVHTFNIALLSAGTQSISVNDLLNGVAGSETGIIVNPGAGSTLALSGFPTSVTAGQANSITVTIADAFGNVAPSYTGTVQFSSSDSQAGLPASYMFTAADAGVHVFNVTLNTPGTSSITVSDTATSGIAATQANIKVNAGAASTLVVSGFPGSIAAGLAGNLTVTAEDAFGNIVTGYLGTVHLTSSDGQAVLPATYAFTAADAGVHVFSVTLKTAGTQSISVADASTGAIAGSETGITVNAWTASTLIVSGLASPQTAGVAGTVTITAKDVFGNTAAGYTGTVHFTSSDGQAGLPGNYTFTAADAGVHVFSVTLKTAGSQSVTAADTTTGSITGSQGAITVNPAAANTFVVSGLASPQTAGASGTVTIVAKDAFGNTATGYAGTVHFTSSDGQAGLPGNYAFTVADAGVHVFSVTLKTAGTQSVTATDTTTGSITGSQGTVTVNPAATNMFLVSGFASPATAGVAGTLTVTAKDAFGNTTTGYTGTVHFTSSDALAALPANYAFAATDAGSHVFSVTLKTAGTQSISAADTTTSGVAGSQTGIAVNAGAASTLLASGFSTSVTAGSAGSLTVTLKDAFGNAASGYRGTVHFSSSDAQAALPANYAFTAADAGIHVFSVALKTAGTQSITATDTVTGTLTSTQGSITVTPAATGVLVLAGFASPSTAGVASTVTVTATDAFGNKTTSYRGTVHFSSSDAQAVLPANYTFTDADAGVHVFGGTLKTAGSQSITAADTATSSIAGTQAGINVNAAAASSLVVAGFANPTTAGLAGTVTVTAHDAFGNTAPGYRGTVHFTSTDAQATLPANYAFTATDAGAHVFSVTLKTAGSRSISVTDTVTGSITGTQSAITVNPAAASVFLVAGFASPITAGVAGTFTLTARDAFGNTANGYRGTVHFTSSDAQGSLPANYTFTATDAGVHVFGATLKTAGGQSITATDTATNSITGSQGGITVNAAAGSTFVLSGFPSPVTAGTVSVVRISVRDAFGNTATGYRGTVHFTSTDPQAVLPGNYTFSPGDAGNHTFGGVQLRTVGSMSITATDTANSTITGTQASITVTPGPASTMKITSSSSFVFPGTPFTITMTLTDAFGNLATNYTGTVRFTSSDKQAGLPANYTFTSADAGVHVFSVTLRTFGNQTITGKDTANGPLANSITVFVAQNDQGPPMLLSTPDNPEEDDPRISTEAQAVAALFANQNVNDLLGTEDASLPGLTGMVAAQTRAIDHLLAARRVVTYAPATDSREPVAASSSVAAVGLTALLAIGWNAQRPRQRQDERAPSARARRQRIS